MAKTGLDLVQEAKKTVKEVTVEEANALIAEGTTALDVRENAEYEAGAIPGAIHISRGVLEFKITDHPDFQARDMPIVIYCRSGARSVMAAASLQSLGYNNVCSMAGGYMAWSGEN
jgi:rhodanese-related sulfurtransferase